ncbi:MAG: 3-deoxy-D-manno-octulosonic acid transferase [Planctomycetales bacterium]|nr:3-deoxy-D-manno-octulosonic acid transferase [Planctomycetales bacterium]
MSRLRDAVYCLLALLAIPYWLWGAWRHAKYRQGWSQKLLGNVPEAPRDRVVVWLHAVSLGEVNLLGTLIAALRRERPDVHCYITTTTRTGYESACKRYSDFAQISYFPFDFSWAVRRALRRVRPHAIVLAELEVWPNLIHFATEQGIPVTIANGRLSPRSFRGYRRIRAWLNATFARVDRIGAQTREYAARFEALGARPERVFVTGSLKFDGAESNRANDRTVALQELAGFTAEQTVLLAGSTFPPEEEILVEVYRRVAPDFPELRMVIVPRHPERFAEVAEILAKSGLPWSRRSELLPERPAEGILLVDTIGELGAWWGTADLAYVGGSMGSRGGQNMIEPAAYGAAVSFGPQTTNFRDIVQLMHQADAAVTVQDAEQLEAFVRRGLTDRAWRQEMGQRAAELVRLNQGATQRTVQMLLPLLPAPLSAPAGCQAA